MFFLYDVSFFPLFWFGFAVLCLFLEVLFHGLFYFLSCALSAIVVSLLLLYAPMTALLYQLLLFFVFSTLFFIFLRRIVHKKFDSQKDKYKSHLFSLVQEEGEVVREISENTIGQVRIKNEVWPAYVVEKNETIKKGQKVIVVGISGASVLVREKK